MVGVISLPGGVFNPYSGVKTSIIIIDKHIAKNKEDIPIAIKKGAFGIIYDFDLLHQVYPFQENEKRLSFVMNININRLRGEREWNPEKFKWEYTHTPHEKDDVRNNI